jgi:DNA-binding response OmpR family regulator
MTTETAGADGPVIYVVDDDKAIRLALGALLRSVGLRVEAFESPDEFLRFPHSSGPSCLILDVRLRGKSGMAFHQEIVNSGMRMPVLFMTGHEDLRQKELAKRRVHLAATAFRAPRYSSMRARSRSSGNRLMATSGVEGSEWNKTISLRLSMGAGSAPSSRIKTTLSG